MTNSSASYARNKTTMPNQATATVIRTVTKSSFNVKKPSKQTTTQSKWANTQRPSTGFAEPSSFTSNDKCVSATASTTASTTAQLYNSHTNLVVRSVQDACAFYTKAFGWTTIKQTTSAAVMQYKNYTFYLVAETHVAEYFGYTAVSPQTSGHCPSMTTTLLCDDVTTAWDAAIQSGAIPVKSPFRKGNGSCCATLVGPDNYVWFITDSNNFFC